jgi:hypothetical protein
MSNNIIKLAKFAKHRDPLTFYALGMAIPVILVSMSLMIAKAEKLSLMDAWNPFTKIVMVFMLIVNFSSWKAEYWRVHGGAKSSEMVKKWNKIPAIISVILILVVLGQMRA